MNYARHSIFCDYSSINIQKYVFVNLPVLCVCPMQKLLKTIRKENSNKMQHCINIFYYSIFI